MQGGFRRSMRRALSMSMDDGQRPVIPASPSNQSWFTKRTKSGKLLMDVAKEESGRPNVRYVKAATTKSSLKEKENKAGSPVRGRKPSARVEEMEEEDEPETPEPVKRGRGRPPKSAGAKATSSGKGKKPAKLVEPESEEDEEAESEEEGGEGNGDEQAQIEEQLLQEEKSTRRGGLRELRGPKVKEEETAGRTFRSVRLQAKHMK